MLWLKYFNSYVIVLILAYIQQNLQLTSSNSYLHSQTCPNLPWPITLILVMPCDIVRVVNGRGPNNPLLVPSFSPMSSTSSSISICNFGFLRHQTQQIKNDMNRIATADMKQTNTITNVIASTFGWFPGVGVAVTET